MADVHGNSKLGREAIRSIYLRVLNTEDRIRDIAEEYGITHLVVCNIARRRNHRFITEDLPDINLQTRATKPPVRYGYIKTLLDAQKVKEIRKRLAQGEAHQAIAHDYGVNRQVITSIHSGRTWKHV